MPFLLMLKPFLSSAIAFLRPLAPYILIALIGAVVVWFVPRVTVPILGWEVFGGGAQVRIDKWKDTVAERDRTIEVLTATVNDWNDTWAEEQENRRIEQEQAQAALDAAVEQCDARVEEARRSSGAIRTIVERETVYDESMCPVRRLVGNDSLRDVLTGAAPAGGAGSGASDGGPEDLHDEPGRTDVPE